MTITMSKMINSSLKQLGQRTPRISRNFARLLLSNPNLLLGSIILIVVLLAAIFAPLLTRTEYTRLNPIERLQSPSAEHWFGTDKFGWDVFDRTLVGSRPSLLVGFSVTTIVVLFGLVIGTVSGYFRRADIFIMRAVDAVEAFPTIILALSLIAVLGASLRNVIIAISVASLPGAVRLVRGLTLQIRETAYVDASKAAGAQFYRILALHVVPNVVPLLVVHATALLAGAILTEASLSFLGLGTPEYIPTWGNAIASGRPFLRQAIWISLFPGLVLSLTVLAFNLVGDGVRDVLDPKMMRSML